MAVEEDQRRSPDIGPERAFLRTTQTGTSASGVVRGPQRKNGDVVVTHHARVAAILRGRAAIKLVSDVGRGDPQEVMAKVTMASTARRRFANAA